MGKLIFTLILISGLISLNGCIISNITSSSTQLEIKFSGLETEGYTVFIENNGVIKRYSTRSEKYITWGGIPSFRFGSHPPTRLDFKHTIYKVSWSEYKNLNPTERQFKINNHAQSLPPSAWRTHTIYPKQLLEQGTSMPIWDTRYNKIADDQKAKSRVTVTLYIDGNGKVSQDIKRTLVLSDSVW